MAFKRLFGDFADKNLSDLWAELNRRIEAAFSEVGPGGGGLFHQAWANSDLDADSTQYAIGISGKLTATAPGFTWDGVGGQSDQPVQIGQDLEAGTVRVLISLNQAPGVSGDFTAGLLVDGAVAASHTFTDVEQTFEIALLAGIPKGALVSPFVQRGGDAAASAIVVTLVGTPVTP